MLRKEEGVKIKIKGGSQMDDKKTELKWNISMEKLDLEDLTNRKGGNNSGIVVNLSKAPIVVVRYKNAVENEGRLPKEVRQLGMSVRLRNRVYNLYWEVYKDYKQVYGESESGYFKIVAIKNREIKINKYAYLIKGDTELIYVNAKDNEIKTLRIPEEIIDEIKVFKNNAYIALEDEEVCIVRNGYPTKPGLKMEWKDKTRTPEYSGDRVTNETISFKVNGYNVNIKIHQLMILLVYNQLVLSGLILSGNSGMCIDHINGCPTDNRIDNLQVILQSENAGKRGTLEEHLEYSKKCYDYLPELEEISNRILSKERKDVA